MSDPTEKLEHLSVEFREKLSIQADDRQRSVLLEREADRLLGLNPRDARATAVASLEFARRGHHENEERKALFIIAVADYYCGDLQASLQQVDRLLAVAKVVGDRDLLFRSLNLKGGVEASRGNIEATLRAGLQALEMAEEDGNLTEQCTMLLNLGIHYREWEEYDESVSYLLRALESSSGLHSLVRLSRIYLALGSTWVMKGDYQKALSYLNSGLEIERERGNQLYLSDLLNSLAVVHGRLEDYDKAEAHYLEAFQIRKRLGDRLNVTASLLNLGMLALRRQQPARAIEFYQEALQLAIELSAKKYELRLEACLSEAYEAFGDDSHALAHLKRAMILNDELKQGSVVEGEKRIRAQIQAERMTKEAGMERLRNNELRLAEQIARVGGWRFDQVDGTFTGSEMFATLIGTLDGSVPMSLEKFLLRVSESDRNSFERCFMQCLSSNATLDMIVRSNPEVVGTRMTLHVRGEWTNLGDSMEPLLTGTLQDISLQLEADLQRSEKERLQGMLEMAGAFSHELNQSLQVITTSADLLIELHPDEPRISDSAERIIGGVSRMMEIIERLKSMTRYKTRGYVGGVRIAAVDDSDQKA